MSNAETLPQIQAITSYDFPSLILNHLGKFMPISQKELVNEIPSFIRNQVLPLYLPSYRRNKWKTSNTLLINLKELINASHDTDFEKIENKIKKTRFGKLTQVFNLGNLEYREISIERKWLEFDYGSDIELLTSVFESPDRDHLLFVIIVHEKMEAFMHVKNTFLNDGVIHDQPHQMITLGI